MAESVVARQLILILGGKNLGKARPASSLCLPVALEG